MTKHFRLIGILEGISFLVLLLVAMPLKYFYGMPLAVRLTGSAHGFLFVLYVMIAYLLAHERGWETKKLLKAWVAAVIPFGPFFFKHE